MNADDWDRRYETAERLWSVGPNRFVAEELAELAPGRALDLAAGEGRNAVWLAGKGFRVRAVDFSEVALGRGRELARKHGVEVDWERADLREWSPPEEAYDLVLISYLHLPWAQMQRVVRAAARAVAPGGVFLSVGHDIENLAHGTGGPSDPAVLYSAEQIAAELHGFEIEKATRVRRPVGTEHREQGDRDAIDNLVRAVRRCDR